jgi:regulation of enolase protein 1 (concanavalin A-like superfamily)
MARNDNYKTYNVPATFQHPEDASEYFSLAAPSNSRIWRIATGDQLSAPMLLKELDATFQIAEVTLSAPFEMFWDQAGLVIFLNMSPTDPWIDPDTHQHRRRRPPPASHRGKWATATLQMNEEGLCLATTVAAPSCAPDLSFSMLALDSDDPPGVAYQTGTLRLRLEKVGDALWVWYRVPFSSSYDLATAGSASLYQTPEEVSNEWRKTREIGGFFAGQSSGNKAEIMIGCFASRYLELDRRDERDFVVEFEELAIM